MFRIVVFIIVAFINIFLRASGITGYGYRRSYDYGGINPYGTSDVATNTSDYLQGKIKQWLALRRVKQYLTRYSNTYALKNRNVSFSYNYSIMQFSCINLKSRKESFKINFTDNKENNQFSYLDDTLLKNAFRESFNQVCAFYDANTSYEQIFSYLSENYRIEVQKKQEKETKSVYSEKSQSPQYVDDYFKDTIPKKLIDINTATQEEIAKLPGINIVMAKKIIIARDDIGGFLSKQEFYERFKIKPHFQSQMDKVIWFSKREAPRIKENSVYSEDNAPENNEVQTDDIVIDSIELKPHNNKDRIIDI